MFFIDSLRAGGKERQAVTLLKELARQGLEILVVCLGTERFFEEALGTNRIRLEYVPRRRRWDPVVFIRLRAFFRDFRPDLLHTTCWMTSFYALPLAKSYRTPVIGSIRNAFECRGVRWRIERLLLRLCDARISNSRAGFISRGFHTEGPGNHVVYNGFDFSRPTRFRSPLPELVTEKQIVGMVAEFKDDKDYGTYFEAARRVLVRRKDVKFIAVGGGKNQKALSERYSEPDIVFLGRQTEVEAIVRTFAIGVLATYTEGISNALMEYMALGKAVVATNGGGTSELVVDGVTGYLVPPRDAQALAAKIELLLDAPTLASVLGKAGQQRLKEKFSLQGLSRGTIECYRAVLRTAAEGSFGWRNCWKVWTLQK
jgi:glycosyltransferase involved in cell wall biosynthesis